MLSKLPTLKTPPSCYNHEDGDVCVTEDTAEAAKGHLANFPEKVYWDRLVQVFERNGLAAEVTPAGIQVSW